MNSKRARSWSVVLWLSLPACSSLLGANFDGLSLAADAGTSHEDGTKTHSPNACRENEKACPSGCVSKNDPAFGCGASATCEPCSVAHGKATCNAAGACAVGSCDPGRANCTHSEEDCTTNVTSDPEHCGACDKRCETTQVCGPTGCVSSCSEGLTRCERSCVNIGVDAEHCGACDKRCPATQHGVATCNESTCGIACDAGYAPCAEGCCATSTGCAVTLQATQFDFEKGDHGFAHAACKNMGNDWPYDPWMHGTSSYPVPWSGRIFGTELDKAYAQCSCGTLTSPSIDLSSCANTAVSLHLMHAHWFWTDYTDSDGGFVEASGDGGATWQAIVLGNGGVLKLNPERGRDANGKAVMTCPNRDGLTMSGHEAFVKKSADVGHISTLTESSLPLPRSVVTRQTRVRFTIAAGASSTQKTPEGSRQFTGFGWRIGAVRFTAN